MGMPRKWLDDVRRAAIKQGASVTSGQKGGGFRVATARGVVIVHTSPSNPERYRMLCEKALAKIGVTLP